ncbi:MAG: DUF448 domain-containing protein [Erythrobacter sp.]|uniref:DUF448 domain-containing protein n=1 Tax=Erythrobacter sp. TaxID=1042 RepID=UPI00260371DC|nr:DUF448 domain-containing protein [Erythrobacter sp.]MDJ0978647.1 DUF448 domain-containing protein [Erythrobacter sp.]
MRTPPNEALNPDIVEDRAPGSHSGSERRCVLSGETHPRESLVRLAISPARDDGTCDVLPDAGAKAPGRGAWIAPDSAALETAIANGQLKGALARAFKGAKLTIPNNLPELVEAALRRHVTDRLGLEMRAGNIVLGSGRIAEQARCGSVALLLHAADASEDGRKKLDQAWRVGLDAQGSGVRGTVLPLDREALSVALGRENVVHLGVSGHSGDLRAANRVEQAVSRLMKFVRTEPLAAAQPDAQGGADAPSHLSSGQTTHENT